MTSATNYTWHKIAQSPAEINWGANGLTELEVAGKKVCLALQNDTIHACTHKCPHAGGPMADGYLDALGNIVCPLHRYKFSISNGRNTSGEGYFLKIFPVQIKEDGVFIGFAQNNLFGWLK
jgi:3-phenylpropionate/trans-cinnamate dioxygenase ferredoxin subunit